MPRKSNCPRWPEVFPTGLHYLPPIVVLVWFLMVDPRQSPSKSAYFAKGNF